MKTLLFLLFFSAQIFAADKIVVTPTPSYLGGGSKIVVKDSAGKTTATGKVVERPKYLGGGTVTTVKDSSGKVSSVVTTVKNKIPGGGTVTTVKKK